MKLNKLILSGFKSFADRTEFDFDDGVSCVVGPNGCGKSNIVDAIKWVLGEQSAKSLRGSQMMDVIFNGSSGRRPSGMVEVTLVFSNSASILRPNGCSDQEAGEVVSIGRRLFRNGQSEYLINKIPCRLKDIREMFMDTGVGNDAYAVIEQGHIESFLQASPDDRRALFDEAAGISKYKARKKEALRRLDRVEQNLLRLDDIVGEVEKRLRSIKYQAGKARSYQVHSEKLKELKGLYFLAQYHTQLQKRTDIQRKLDEDSNLLASIGDRLERLEGARSGAEFEASDLERTASRVQSQIASLTAQITACEQRQGMLGEKVRELREQITNACRRCEELEAKMDDCRQGQQSREAELAQTNEKCAELAEQGQQASKAHGDSEAAIAQLEARLEDQKAGMIELMQRTAQLHNDMNAAGIRRENLNSRRSAVADKGRKIAGQLEELLARRSQDETKLRDVRETLGGMKAKLDQTKVAGRELSDRERELQGELATARERRSSAAGRIEALREMLSRLEGVGSGTKRVLEAKSTGRLQAIRGMLGDFVETDVDHARMVEAALAGADEQLIAMSFDQVRAEADELGELLGDGGTVEILCMDRLDPYRHDLSAGICPLVQGRVIDCVRFEPWLAPAMWRLLGRTLVVATLGDAAAAAKVTPTGTRFVTPNGEVLEGDGRVRFGSANQGAGVISQRSELAALGEQMGLMDRQIEQMEGRLEAMGGERSQLEQGIRDLRMSMYEANTQQVEGEGSLGRLEQQIAELEKEKPLIADDLASLAEEIEQAVRGEQEAGEAAAELEKLNTQRQEEISHLEGELSSARQGRDELAGKITELKVAQAQGQEKKLSLGELLRDLVRQGEQMVRDLADSRSEIETNRKRLEDAANSIETAKADCRKLSEQRESQTGEAETIEQTRASLSERLEQIREQLAQSRSSHDDISEKVSARRVEVGQADAHVGNLISRARDEMNIDLPECFSSYEHDQQRDWDAVEREINELRGKIERLGNVNLDAIGEQEELEKRREFLAGQLDDVKNSRKQLNELIRRINKESREKFMDTFESVRANFQELFRKLFGGGRADVILTDPDDVLESGIEILARPPGKELRSLSLLSGGEKTMTALALMFSMFKHRPSPFCLLDEVDAALDEANVERFSRLLQEFVEHSQFIIISHAKRTMSMANVLYGVTMQEPGVSKRISVRFEDVGHKLDAQLQPAGT